MTMREIADKLSEATQGLIFNTNFELSHLSDNDPITKENATEIIKQVFYAIAASNDAIIEFLKQMP